MSHPPESSPPASAPSLAAPVLRSKLEPAGSKSLAARALGPALQLWLRTQADAIARLSVQIESQDAVAGNLSSRQMLAGRIPQVRVDAGGVIYRGIHLGELELVAQDIRMNLGQALRGKPLRLLSPLAVDIALALTEADLNASLAAPLLAERLQDWLALLLPLLRDEQRPDDDGPGSQPWGLLSQPRLGLGEAGLVLQTQWRAQAQAPALPLAVQAQLRVSQGNRLQLQQPRWCSPPPLGFRQDLAAIAQLPLCLGGDIRIERLTIQAAQLVLAGQIQVQP